MRAYFPRFTQTFVDNESPCVNHAPVPMAHENRT